MKVTQSLTYLNKKSPQHVLWQEFMSLLVPLHFRSDVTAFGQFCYNPQFIVFNEGVVISYNHCVLNRRQYPNLIHCILSFLLRHCFDINFFECVSEQQNIIINIHEYRRKSGDRTWMGTYS